MKKGVLIVMALAVAWPICATAKVGAVDNAHQELTVFGDFDSGIYMDGPVAKVRELLEDSISGGLLNKTQEDLAISLLSELDGFSEASSVMIQPMGEKGSVDDTMEADTYVNQGNPSTNYGGSSEVQVGCYGSGAPHYEMRGFWCCYSCPGAEVYMATLNAYIKQNDLDAAHGFYAARANSSWDEYSVTWNNQPGSSNENYNSCTTYDTGWFDFTATNAVTAVCNSGANNYGLTIYGDSSWASSSNCYGSEINIHIDTAQGSGNRAYLTIDYTYAGLSNLDAEGEDGKIVVRWSTSYEQNNAGWNVYRALSKNGQYIKLNEFLIPPYQYSYEYVDTEVTNGVSYCYKIQAVDLGGSVQMFGPVCATPSEEDSDSENGGVSVTYQNDGFTATAGCGW